MGRQKKQRLIFHCDCNNFFASCECLDHPELKEVPLLVNGTGNTFLSLPQKIGSSRKVRERDG